MARTKNRTMVESKKLASMVQRWNAGEYIRLSREDLNRGRDDSNSVTNQKKLLNEFSAKHGEEFESVQTYVDDGYTGTDTERDGFQRLLADVISKKVNCVIVKDLSRLSRNYTDAGSLIENLFVKMNVRFISLVEGVDSYLNPDSVSSIIVPITNVINDNFCYQTSKKIRQVFDYKRRNGEFIGAFAPYGYSKDPQNKHKLIIDEKAADVVKDIFQMFLNGKSKNFIVRTLNDHGILCPSVYKREHLGLKYQNPHTDITLQSLWCAMTITNILRNRMYCGDMVQGRYRVKSYKVHIQETVPKEEWFIVENTHEAIIDRKAFQKVQELLCKDTRTAPQKKSLYLFSGFLRCADCGKAMSRSKMKSTVYYFCRTYKDLSKTACSKHMIKHNRLEIAVLYAIQQQVFLAVDYSKIIEKINRTPIIKNQSKKLADALEQKERELAKILRYKQVIYQDWKDGEIDRTEYSQMKENYVKQLAILKEVINKLKEEIAEFEKGVDTENPFLAAFRQYQNINTLTRDVLVELVDHIKVYEGGNISIVFRFADELYKVQEFIQINTHSEAV